MRSATRIPLTRRASARALWLLSFGVVLGGAGLLAWLLATAPARDGDQHALVVAISVIIVGVPTVGLAVYLGGLAYSVAHPGVAVRPLVRRAMLVVAGAVSAIAGVATLAVSGPALGPFALLSLAAAAFYALRRDVGRRDGQ